MIAALFPVVRGLVFAIIGYAIGGGLGYGLSLAAGNSFPEEPIMALGYLLAVVGWLLGVGMWEVWAAEWFGFPVNPHPTKGWGRYFRFTTDHKVIGIQYLVTFVIVFLLAGLLAMVIRMQLAVPGQPILNGAQYNVVMSMHGILMIAVAVAAIIGGFGNYVVPLLIGAEDVAFPRLNALSYWIVPPVAAGLFGSLLFGGFDAGWTAYPPLSVVTVSGQLFFMLAFVTLGLASIFGGLNFIVTIITLRAPGMTWFRMPVFAWSVFFASMISVTTTQFVAAALLTVVFDRVAGTAFYNPNEGGTVLLYEHLFWFYSHPAVYVMALPAFGMILEIITHLSRKTLYGYKWVVASFFGIVSLSAIVWAHHMFTSGMPENLHTPFMLVTELISAPTGMVFLASLGTMWRGKLWLNTPMLFVLGFIFNFLIGGLTGIYLADVPTDIQFHGSYFVVAHFHYTIMGGEIFAMMAAVYFWFPKMTGRMYNERLGKLHFYWMFLAYNATFLAMFYVGFQGMARRVSTYQPNLASGNMTVSIFSFLLGASFIIFFFNLLFSWIRGPKAPANPWRARTLEWQVSSPPPVENFPSVPHVLDHPYGYGLKDSVHATFDKELVAATNGHISNDPAHPASGALER